MQKTERKSSWGSAIPPLLLHDPPVDPYASVMLLCHMRVK
jgi:hypothetical protein